MSYSYPFFDDVYAYYNQTVTFFGKALDVLPGSPIVKRYIKSSYQNDPLRTFIEFLLLVFAAYYVLRKPRTSPDNNYVEFTEKVSKIYEFLKNLVSIANEPIGN